ncbi:MAG: hypothetical protein A2V66_16160 [Ignavibacteria bacterium RBG_13_36_8]|nr:MAG: hypothetical protein A2V66_16160 [Ignavibacteria bacterium RBG_13_36_8]
MLKKISLLLFIVLASQAFAQGIAIGPQLGYQKSKNADEGSVLFGGMVRLKLSPSFAVEGAINYRQEKYNNGTEKVTSYPIMASALIYILPFAYGVAGAGWYNSKYEVGGTSETSSPLGYHVGAGAEIALGSIVLTGDIRYVFLKYQFENVSSASDLKANFYVIMAGILLDL